MKTGTLIEYQTPLFAWLKCEIKSSKQEVPPTTMCLTQAANLRPLQNLTYDLR